jgi:hypothetical protein
MWLLPSQLCIHATWLLIQDAEVLVVIATRTLLQMR